MDNTTNSNFSPVFEENGECVLDEEKDLRELENLWALTKSAINNNLDLLEAIDLTYRAIEDTRLENGLLKEARRPISYLAKRLSLSRQQACLFSIYFSRYDDPHIELSDIRRHLNCSNVQALRFRDDVAVLEERGLIVSNGCRAKGTWFVPERVVSSIVNNHKPKEVKKAKLTAEALFDQIDTLCCRRAEESLSLEAFCNEVVSFFTSNMHLRICQALSSYNFNQTDLALIVWACNMLVSRSDENITRSDITNIYDVRLMARCVFNNLVTGKARLMELGLIERAGNFEYQDKDVFRLTEKAKTELLSELDLEVRAADPYQGLIDPASITPKDLFYNPVEKEQLDRLSKLLQDENYRDVTARLEKSGLRKGITVLLSGPAGTGKTEFVQQIARKTGRHIMPVNVSQLLNSYVGESEKNVKKVLAHYAALEASCPVTPILFLDEVDSIISKRMTRASRSVDKMSNNIQALLLQGLSEFNGILIGTTNLAENMADEAIERRFLIKCRVEKPSENVRFQIWHSLLPDMGEDLLKKVAAAYDFSGGKIENVVRKIHMSSALEGIEPDEATVIKFCDEEQAGYGKSNTIGF